MTQTRSSTRLAAAIGLVCGLAGGVAGALVLSSRADEPSSSLASTPKDPELLSAIEDLTREVRGLRESLGNQLSEPAPEPSSRALVNHPLDVDRLVAAIERLTANSGASVARGSSPSRHADGLVGTDRPRNVDRLRELLQEEDHDVRSRKHRFLTYQQVLDRFGAPDEVYQNGIWHYELDDAGDLDFRFYDGLLMSIE